MHGGYFDDGGGINGNRTDGDGKGKDNGHPMLTQVISLLRALVGILDIITDSFGKHS